MSILGGSVTNIEYKRIHRYICFLLIPVRFYKIAISFPFYIFAYTTVVLFNSTNVIAQHNFFYKEDIYYISSYTNYPADNLQNDSQAFPTCKSLLTDTSNGHNTKFKRVVESDYTSNDSILKHKKLVSRVITMFNDKGYGQYRVTLDSNGVDSIKYFYDEHFLGIRWEYTSQLQLGDKYVLIRDKKGRILKDSNTYLGNGGNKNLTGYFVVNFTYDTAGNCVKYFWVSHNANWPSNKTNDDTIIIIKQYDNKNRIIASHEYGMDMWEAEYYKYDNSSNIIDAVIIDSTRRITALHLTKVFDTKNRVVLETKFDYYHGNHMTSITYNADGGRTDTTEFSGKNKADPNSCTNITKSIEVYNKYGDLVSTITTSLNEGKTTKTNSIHKSHYNLDGKLLCDSETVITESQMSYNTVLTVITYKYDTKGNKTEFTLSGGAERWIYTYNEKNKLVKEVRYGSSSDKPNYIHQIRYYPDGVTVKEDITDNMYGRIIKKYGKDTEQTEWTSISPGNVNQVITEYFQ